MIDDQNVIGSRRNRRGFLKTGLAAAGATTLGTALLTRSTPAFAQTTTLSAGDIAILQFLAARMPRCAECSKVTPLRVPASTITGTRVAFITASVLLLRCS